MSFIMGPLLNLSPYYPEPDVSDGQGTWPLSTEHGILLLVPSSPRFFKGMLTCGNVTLLFSVIKNKARGELFIL